MATGLSFITVRAASLWLLAALLTLTLAACTQAASADIPTARQNPATLPVDTDPAPAADLPVAGESEEAAAVDTDPATVPEEDAALAYARCIRANGYPDWPDPDPDGRIMLRRDAGMRMDDPKLQAAMQACQDLRPAGAGGGSAIMGAGGIGSGFANEEQALAFARCMRENGVPDFPDPNPGGGGIMIVPGGGAGSGLNSSDPRFQAAMQTCRTSVLEAGQ
jgi:hypothetical protein